MKLVATTLMALVAVGCASRATTAKTTAPPPFVFEPAVEAGLVASVRAQFDKICADQPKAAVEQRSLYEKACAANDASGCTKAGMNFMCGKGASKDAALAMARFDKSCTLGAENGCAIAAQARMADNLSEGLSALVASCDRGNAHACATAGATMLLTAAPDTRARGLVIVRRSCDLGVDDGCANLAAAELKGVGGPTNIPDALAVARGACARSHLESCTTLATMELDGIGMPQDIETGAKRLAKACEDGSAKSCFLYAQGIVASDQSTPEEGHIAAKLMEQACRGGYREACPRPRTSVASPTEF